MVEILKGKIAKPSFDWLKIVKTAEARKKIKGWFAIEEKKLKEAPGIKEEEKEIKKQINKKVVVAITKTGAPIIQDQTGLMYKLAKCCDPEVGDKIKGYMTVNQGVSVHTAQCKNVKTANGKRLLTASWSRK